MKKPRIFILKSMNTLLPPFRNVFLPLFIIVLSFYNPLSAQNLQNKDSLPSKHEIRLDIFQLIILPGFDISYEHFIDPVSSWGVTGFVNLDSNLSEGYRFDRFEFSPYYRLYFSQKEQNNSGFFVQPFISWLSTAYDSYTNSTDSFVSKDFLGFAGGALIGFKWINQKNYSFEVHGGVGRYFMPTNEESATDNTAYPRINFSIGKRF